MSGETPDVGLSEDERTRIARTIIPDWYEGVESGLLHGLLDTVEAILESRLAAVEASHARDLAAQVARAEAAALDAVLARADDGIEFGPKNYLLVVRIVAAVRAALADRPAGGES